MISLRRLVTRILVFRVETGLIRPSFCPCASIAVTLVGATVDFDTIQSSAISTR